MNTSIKVFESAEFGKVRTWTSEQADAWFCAADVCSILQYANGRDAVNRHVDEGDVVKRDTLTDGGVQLLTYINESGLYSLVMGSKLPKAKEFKHWVTSEVLPSIRKEGMYITDRTLESLLDDPDFAIATFQRLKEERERRIEAERQLEEQHSKVIFANAVEASTDSILVRDLAKTLRQNGVETGQNRLFEELRRRGYLLHDNSPSQRAMDMGLFEIQESSITLPNGYVRVTRTTKVTGKGQVYFTNLFLNRIN